MEVGALDVGDPATKQGGNPQDRKEIKPGKVETEEEQKVMGKARTKV